MHANEPQIPASMKILVVICCIIAVIGSLVVSVNAVISMTHANKKQTSIESYIFDQTTYTSPARPNVQAYETYEVGRETFTDIDNMDSSTLSGNITYIDSDETKLDSMRETGHIRLMEGDDYFVNDVYRYVETWYSNKYLVNPLGSNWKTDNLGFVKDDAGYAICAGPEELYNQIIETSAGPTRVVDIAPKIVYGQPDNYYTVIHLYTNWQ